MDTDRFRTAFPVVERVIYLNHASESPLARPVRSLLDQFFDVSATNPETPAFNFYRVKDLLAEMFGGSVDEYALMPNTTTGIGTVALGHRWRPGDNLVIPDQEFPANAYPWLRLRDQGVEVRVAPLDAQLRVKPEAVAALVDSRTRAVAVSAVGYLSGFRVDLRALSEIAHAVGALLVVDGIQACGAAPVRVDEDGIDVLAAGGFKWLLGPVGTGFAYIRRSAWERIAPVLPGAFASTGGAEDAGREFHLRDTAMRYESGCLGFSLFYAWSAGLELLLEAGVPAVHRHLIGLTDRLAAGLTDRGYRVVTPMGPISERSGILSFTSGNTESDAALVERLKEKSIAIALRGGRCRVSPHFYNTLSDIDRLLEAL